MTWGARNSRAKKIAQLALPTALLLVGGAANGWPQMRFSAPTRYVITLANPAEHLLRVEMTLPPGPAQRELQLPVWNATYQVRDFAEYIRWVHARGRDGAALPIRKTNKSHWQADGLAQGGVIEYEILADKPGPFGAELNGDHAFLNLAQILMYSAEGRDSPAYVRFANVPDGWHEACALQQEGLHPDVRNDASGSDAVDKDELAAANYDNLVDSPVELGTFQEASFIENGGHYRLVVDAPAAAYNMPQLTETLRKIVHAETTWMQDRPFRSYLFLYHFPMSRGDGGMEHAFSTAIELSAHSLASDPDQLASMAAHEFFHLWNVKRIRPQSLVPVDYTRENYTRALWFSEGVTSTVEQYALLESQLIDEKAFLKNLSEEITTLQNRPAHLTQSAEESSLDAWLEKYPEYRLPNRSISYYNKGFLLGIFLDLAMRKASSDESSLRELLLYLNQTYARKERSFDDSNGIRKAAEAVSGADLADFFQKYVAGTTEIPYDDFLSWVGLRATSHEKVEPEPGFRAARNFDAAPVVVSVTPHSAAAHVGLSAGDTIVLLDGAPVSRDLESRISKHSIGDVVKLRVRGPNGVERDLSWKLDPRRIMEYEVVEVANPTTEQLLHRRNWYTLDESRPTHAQSRRFSRQSNRQANRRPMTRMPVQLAGQRPQ